MTGPVAAHDTSVLARLRDETRPEHAAAERLLDLTGDGLTRDGYRRRLETLYGFYRPLDGRVRSLGGWDRFAFDLDQRRKLPALEADLIALGVPSLDAVPVCGDLPELRGHREALGALYVTEGATLGGRYITRHVERTLGVTPETGGRFFHGYGERTGEMWRAFQAVLVSAGSTREAADEVVRGAVGTFRALVRWCETRDGQ